MTRGYVSFNKPVPVPTKAAFEPPFVCLKFNESWLSYILGAMAALEARETWIGTDSQVELAITRAQDLRVLLMADNDCGQAENPVPNECNVYPATTEFVDIEPVDPRIDPVTIPDGYANTPFTIIDITNVVGLFIGLAVGDLITDLTRFPTGSLPTVIPPDGLARFRVNIKGRSDGAEITVRLKFVKFPSAGFVLITQDDSIVPDLIEYLDLNRRLSSVPPETTNEVIVERKFTGSGHHHIDCTFFPRLSLTEAPFLFYGGGFRSIEICGLEDECGATIAHGSGGKIEDEGMKLRIDPDNECVIQCLDECSGVWGTWLDISKCVPEAAGQHNPGGEPGEGTTNCYDVLLPGNSPWIAPIPVQDGDTVIVSDAGGGWFDGAGWYCPNGQSYALGFCTGSGATDGGDPAPTINHASLIATFDGGASWQDAYNRTLDIPAGLTASNLQIQMNDASLGDNGGSVHFKVCITHQALSVFSHTFDFMDSSGSWTATPVSGGFDGHWVQDSGWADDFNQQVGAGYRLVNFHRNFSERVLTRIEVTFALTQGEHTFNSGDIDLIQSLVGASATTLDSTDYRTPPSSPWEWEGTQLADQALIQIMVGIHLGTGDPGGSLAISQIVIEGQGTDPF